jgi:hypothetical protein
MNGEGLCELARFAARTYSPEGRILWPWLSRRWARWREVRAFVLPETLIVRQARPEPLAHPRIQSSLVTISLLSCCFGV